MAAGHNSIHCTTLTIFLAITTVLFLTISVGLTFLVVQTKKAEVSECPIRENGHGQHPQDEQDDLPLVSISDYHRGAKQRMAERFWKYIEGGATEQLMVADNIAAYRRYRLLPTHLVNVSGFQPEVNVFGKTYATPIGISPSAFHKMAHPGGEIESVRAAQNANTIFMLSLYSSTTLEDVAHAAPKVTKWQMIQIWPNMQNVTSIVIAEAESAGYEALVVTIDDTVGRINYDNLKGLGIPRSDEFGLAILGEFFDDFSKVAGSLFTGWGTWDDIEWIIQQTHLPVILKGVVTPDEARRAVAIGAAGIIVSNHGGRTLDGVPATLDVVASIVDAVNDTSFPVFLDGGIRAGTDVFKAIALGARMVFIGRPTFYGLANGGQQGVENVLEILKREFVNTAKLCGAANMADIRPEMVIPANSKLKFL